MPPILIERTGGIGTWLQYHDFQLSYSRGEFIGIY